MGNLAKRAVFNRFHEFFKEITVLHRYFLQTTEFLWGHRLIAGMERSQIIDLLLLLFISTADYFATKSKLFTYEYADQAFINIDDSYGQILAEKTELPVQSLSRFNENATWHYTRIEEGIAHSDISIRGVGGVLIDSRTTLRGGFNFDNLLMAVAISICVVI